MRKLIRSANAALLAHFAPYIVWDCHGTVKPCWTYAGAEEWLPYCSPRAAIVHAASRTIVTIREQVNAY